MGVPGTNKMVFRAPVYHPSKQVFAKAQSLKKILLCQSPTIVVETVDRITDNVVLSSAKNTKLGF